MIEAFSCNPELDRSEGIAGLSLLPVAQLWALAQQEHSLRGGVEWAHLIARGDAERRAYA